VRLASVSDVALSELLPPAQADTLEPTDNSVMLWFDVTKPLMSTIPDRGAYRDRRTESARRDRRLGALAAPRRAHLRRHQYRRHCLTRSAFAGIGAYIAASDGSCGILGLIETSLGR